MSTSITWQDVPPELIGEILDSVDARGLYLVEHFPDSVRGLVSRDFVRHFSGEGPQCSITATDGSSPEAVNAVLGYDLAHRIAAERAVTWQPAMGLNTTLRRIRAAVLGGGAEE